MKNDTEYFHMAVDTWIKRHSWSADLPVSPSWFSEMLRDAQAYKARDAALPVNPEHPIAYPSNHIPAFKVPKGGSSCSSCEYLVNGSCTNRFYIAWNGSGNIPQPTDEFCSDWYEPKQEPTEQS